MQILPAKLSIIYLWTFNVLGTITLPAQEAAPEKIYRGNGEVSELLNRWHSEKECSGFAGIFYDNRDNNHSAISTSTYLGLQKKPAIEGEKATGPPSARDDAVTIGNCSMASAPQKGGSLPRSIFLTSPTSDESGLAYLEKQYRSNHLYVYPEHRDHDYGVNGKNGYGDLFPINSPYLIISQGSSHSDRAFVEAAILTTAAFPPETRHALEKSRWLMPTLQQILRANYRKSSLEYFDPRRHPVVFDSKHLNISAMLKKAQSTRLQNIPPQAILKIFQLSETQATSPSEILGTTTACIARIHRRPQKHYQISLDASQSIGFAKRGLQYQWKIIQGDPNRIKIRTEQSGKIAHLDIAYHHRFLSASTGLLSNRVDIALFVSENPASNKNVTWSAPAFFCLYSLPNEQRIYDSENQLVDLYREARHDRLEFPPLYASDGKYNSSLAQYAPLLEALLPPLHGETKQSQAWRDFFDLLKMPLNASQIEELTAVLHSLRPLSSDYQKLEQENKQQARRIQKLRSEYAAFKKNEASKSGLSLAGQENKLRQKLSEEQIFLKNLEKSQQQILEKISQQIQSKQTEQPLSLAFSTSIHNPAFTIENSRLIEALLTPNNRTIGKLQQLEQRLNRIGVRRRAPLRASDAYHLKIHNLEVLQLILPDFLQQPSEPNYLDRRLLF